MWNQLKTAFLLGTLSGILLLIGRAIGGHNGVVIALGMALIMNAIIFFFSDKIALSVYKAQPLDESQFGWVYDIVRELAERMHMPMPKLWYIPSQMANAFATGRSPRHASVAVTQGILDILEPHELRGVLAHELSHVKNRDVLVGTIAATLAMAIGYLADMMRWAAIFGHSRDNDRNSSGFGTIIIAILMPFAAMLIQMAISRSREYLADETGAHECEDPLALASALEKLDMSAQRQHARPASQAQATAASLFIVYPYVGGSLMNLFSTHPPMHKRIERLRRMVV